MENPLCPIFEVLLINFFKKAVLEEYVMDPQGHRLDLMIMIKRLHKDWGDF